jgi:predicted  nucleic acid-binding Zn-ribbon protein
MDEARVLLELQARDLKIARLGKQLDEMPVKRAILAARGKIAELEALLARAEAAARGIDAQINRLDDEKNALADKMQHEQNKLLSGEVKNPKELTAISMELDSLRRRHEKLENEELAEMAKRDTAGEQIAKIVAVRDAGKAKEAELVKAFKSHGAEMLTETERLRAERERLAATLPAPTRERYETLRASKHGIAVGSLEGDMCGACRVSLPAKRLEALTSGPDIGVCPMCQRLIVVRKA